MVCAIYGSQLFYNLLSLCLHIFGDKGYIEFRTPYLIILALSLIRHSQTLNLHKFAQYAIHVHMHNDFGSQQPVQSHEPNTVPWGNVYISIDIHIQNHDHFIDAQSDVASPRCIAQGSGMLYIYYWNVINEVSSGNYNYGHQWSYHKASHKVSHKAKP